ncbi:TVP38/TMEM64 family protein [Luteolibacter sp. AS25]|uniref:TVP38/TMEM64 family protein n=1 Tax=Luteolibacter sp. AS25 TaxID=3135776 RepID=UPI00398A86BB
MTAISDYLNSSLEWIQLQGIWAPILFVIVFVVATVAFAPASILSLGAGAVFGLVEGVILVSIASTITAATSFLISRYLLRGWVERQLADRPRFRAIDQAIRHEGWKMVALLRMTPILPFGLQNYGLGLTGISFWQSTFASWLGLLPAIILLVYTGSVAKVAASGTSNAQKIFYSIGFIIAIAVVVRITKIATRAVSRQIELEKNAASGPPDETD